MHISGKEFRKILGKKNQQKRLVPAFSYQSLQKNTIVLPPPKSFPMRKNPTKSTLFRYYFRRGDIPLCASNILSTSTTKEGKRIPVKWFCDPNELDYCYYLPILIDGIAESEVDLRTLAQNATLDLLFRGPNKILPVIPQLILPLKRALNTKDTKIVVGALKLIQQMVLLSPCVGQVLVPFFRTLLPVCNLFKEINVNLGNGIDATRDSRIGDVIEDTLEILEKCGGPDAYINIKYMIPTYESSVLNCQLKQNLNQILQK